MSNYLNEYWKSTLIVNFEVSSKGRSSFVFQLNILTFLMTDPRRFKKEYITEQSRIP